jgi:hypothetical protein
MAGLRIDQLSARTPVYTDVTATTATGGPAGKTTMLGVVESGCSGSTVLTIGSAGAGGSIAYPGATTNISTNTNNLALSAAGFQRLNCTAACDLTGIAPPDGSSHVDGRTIRLVNTGNHVVTLVHESTNSTATNRFYYHGGNQMTVAVGHMIECIYDSVISRWRIWEMA